MIKPKKPKALTPNDDATNMSLLEAAARGLEATVQRLVTRRSIEVNKKHEVYGRTALSYAAGNGNAAIVKALLQHPNINPDLPDRSGRTPLSWAAESAHLDVVNLLLARPDVDADARDVKGQSALLWAGNSRRVDAHKMQELKACIKLLCPVCRLLPSSADTVLAKAPIVVDLSGIPEVEWEHRRTDFHTCGLYYKIRDIYLEKKRLSFNEDMGHVGTFHREPCFGPLTVVAKGGKCVILSLGGLPILSDWYILIQDRFYAESIRVSTSVG